MSFVKVDRDAKGRHLNPLTKLVRVGVRRCGKAGLKFAVLIPAEVADLMGVQVGSKVALYRGELRDEGLIRVVKDEEDGFTLTACSPTSKMTIQLVVKAEKVLSVREPVPTSPAPKFEVTEDGALLVVLPSALARSRAPNPLHDAVARRRGPTSQEATA